VRKEIEDIRAEAKKEEKKLQSKVKAKRSVQVKMLLRRELQNTWRDPRVLTARLGMTVFLATLTSGMMWKQGESEDAQARIAVLTNIVIGTLFGVAQPLVITLPLEKPREFSSGLYDVLSYFFAKIAVEIPIGALQAAIMAVIAYFMGGYQGDFGILYVAAYVNAVCSASFAFAISALARTPREAVEITPLIFVTQFLFADLWIRIKEISLAPIRALQWITPLKYAVNIAYVGEFRNDKQGREIMDDANVEESMIGFYIAMLLLLALIGRLLGIFALRKAGKRTVF
jgi:ABC-type multidrug transport system permease subunit